MDFKIDFSGNLDWGDSSRGSVRFYTSWEPWTSGVPLLALSASFCFLALALGKVLL